MADSLLPQARATILAAKQHRHPILASMGTPDALVTSGARNYGRFDDRVPITNPADAYRGFSRLWHRFRLKEWIGFLLVHPEMSGAMIMQDVRYIASSELFIRDVRTNRLVEKDVILRGGSIGLPPDLRHGGRCTVEKSGYRLQYGFELSAKTISLEFDCAADRRGPAIAGSLTLDVEDAIPALSISAKITPTIDYYTFKQPFPAEGTVTVGDRTYAFDRTRDFALIDENRSYFPYSTRWTWGTFATRVPAGVISSSFVDRSELSDADDESSNWVPGGVEPLVGITFEFDPANPMSTARVRDRDGRLDVTFTPSGHKDVDVNLLAAAIDYIQVAGTYRGTVTSLAGEVFTFAEAPGVLERMKTRF
ncbi:DUF2804 domain-containing protein [Mycolicibacillus trivialis]